MWYKIRLWLQNPSENLWLNPALGAIFAIFFSLLATVSRYFIDESTVPNISIETLSGLLDIISSSMLAVTTFSLSIMVAAFATAASSGTPRAYRLMMNDDNTRIAITSFISAFIYAVIAKIALGLESYGPAGRFVLFISTIFVLIYLIYTLIRWVHTLSQLGSLTTTIQKIEDAGKEALTAFREQPNYGATGQRPDLPVQFHIRSSHTGYFTNFDVKGLNDLAKKHGIHLHLLYMPGKFLDPMTPFIAVHADEQFDEQKQDQLKQTILDHVMVEANRSFLQDPRFGLLVMTEVGQKAMSAGINDTGSAISAINALTRIIIDSKADPEAETLDYRYISLEMFEMKDLIMGSFGPMARDCVANLELNQRMIKSLYMIQQNVPEKALQQAAGEMAIEILQRCLKHLDFKPDQKALLDEFIQLFPERYAALSITENEIHTAT